MVVLDAMKKTAAIRVTQTELNDSPGVCLKLHGPLANIEAATRAAEETARVMSTKIVTYVMPNPDPQSSAAYLTAPDFNPLIEQPSVQNPNTNNENTMDNQFQSPFAVGLIETQGFTAVFAAIDEALKTAAVEVLA